MLPSEALCAFTREAILMGVRADGRSNIDRRQHILTPHSQQQLPGSSHLRLQFESIDILVGVKLKVEEGMPSAEVEVGSMKKLSESQEKTQLRMQQYLQQQLINRASLDALRIKGGKLNSLKMFVEVFLLNQPHMSLLHLMAETMQKAIETLQIPELKCVLNQVSGEETVQLIGQSKQEQITGVERFEVVGILEGRYVVDMSRIEYDAVDAAVLIIKKEGKIVGVESLKGLVKGEEIHQITKLLK